MKPEPVATYRIQLRADFGFQQAADIVAYLSELGVSHLYTSPYLQAAAGSTHGYDIVDPSRVNEELGGKEPHAQLCETLLGESMGHMIDVVPNHMAIADKQNPWWWDVLENGPSSRYAVYFDVDWEASEERWPNKVLLPVLGDHYGRILEDGQFRLSHKAGVFVLEYYEHLFPVDPSSLGGLLERAAEECGSKTLAFLAAGHHRLDRPTITAREPAERRHRDKEVLLKLLVRLCSEEPEVEAAIQKEIDRLNGDPDAMDELIDLQNYRLAFWRTASRDLGYRRFFDIKDLAGLRVENMEVFRATHKLPIKWVQMGWVDALRIDHPDGLRDPSEYFNRLRRACPSAWIVAEKILEGDEELHTDWPIAGTTGYEFLNLVDGLFIDPKGEADLTRVYEDFAGKQKPYDELVRECKQLVLTKLLGSEINRLTSLFVDICEQHRRHRDYTRHEMREVLCETAVCFPVYRTYVSASASNNTVNPEDEKYIDEAVTRAMVHRSDLDGELFKFLRELLLLRVNGSLENELAMRFQQLTGPAMAKGVEDTALYRFCRLTSLNEVGGDPGRFGISPQKFTEHCVKSQTTRPFQMLTTTTHDTKRSEDVRARLALLSEIPLRWEERVNRWKKHNEKYRSDEIPDRNTEYLLYQTLVGAWPIDLRRISDYMLKAVREAKQHTTWTQQNKDYEEKLSSFIASVMSDETFSHDLKDFTGDLVTPGRINSLSQALIKLTSPGIPDIYQGCDLWDLSLVDPDNRRPVDFDLRRRLLHESTLLSAEEIMARMEEGMPKLWLTRQALHLRRQHPSLFCGEGVHQPLPVRGSKAEHLVAFSRGEEVITLAPRLVIGLHDDWDNTEVELPNGPWKNILTGDDEIKGGFASLKRILSRFPVGLLVK